MEISRRNARFAAYVDLMLVIVEIILSFIPPASTLLAFAVSILSDKDFKCQITRTIRLEPASTSSWFFGHTEQKQTLLGAECLAVVIVLGVYVWAIMVMIAAYGCIVGGLIKATNKVTRISKAERAKKVQRWIYFSYVKLPVTVFAVVYGPCSALWLVAPLPLFYFVWRYNEDIKFNAVE